MLRIHSGRVATASTTALVAALLLVPAVAQAQRGDPRGGPPGELPGGLRDAPPPAAWLESGPALAPGQPAQLGYESPRGGYLTILRATTDGDLSVVYPSVPNNRSTGRERGAIQMRADAAPGVGYLFWITSQTPFDFRSYSGRNGRWSPTRFGSRGGDPFEQVDRFARGTTRGRYDVGYSSYRVGASGHDGRRAPAVHDGDYGGYGYGGYPGGAYGDGYAGYGAYGAGDYAGWWGGPSWNGYGSDTWRHRRSWRDREYERAYDRAAYSDPRSRYLRHCADGTLAPYTVPCGAATSPHAGGLHGSRGSGRGYP